MQNRLTSLMFAVLGLGFPLLTAAQPKPLAPGVLKVIPASIDARDSYSLPLPLQGLDALAYSPNFAPVLDTLHGQTQNVVFFRDVWQYEFGFLDRGYVPGGAYEPAQFPQSERECVLCLVHPGRPAARLLDQRLDSLHGGVRYPAVEHDFLGHELREPGPVEVIVRHGHLDQDLVSRTDYPRPEGR